MSTNYTLQAGVSLVREAIGAGKFTACSWGIVTPDGYFANALGTNISSDLAAPPTTPESIFDIASVTKAIPIAYLVAIACQEGRVSLDSQVGDVLSDVHDSVRRITIRDLLAYRRKLDAGLGNTKFVAPGTSKSEVLGRIRVVADQGFHYDNSSPFLLGVLLERLWGSDLGTLANEKLFVPAGLKDTGFGPVRAQHIDRVVATEVVDGFVVRGEVHDEFSRALAEPIGSAGVFSTVPETLTLLQPLLGIRGPAFNISSEMIAQFGTNHHEGGKTMFGLGFGIWDEFVNSLPFDVSRLPAGYSRGAFFKNGFTGAQVSVFPHMNCAIAIFTNRTYPTRPATSAGINDFRASLVREILTSLSTGGH